MRRTGSARIRITVSISKRLREDRFISIAGFLPNREGETARSGRGAVMMDVSQLLLSYVALFGY